jgi:uncharacterized protein (TIGR03437 family)
MHALYGLIAQYPHTFGIAMPPYVFAYVAERRFLWLCLALGRGQGFQDGHGWIVPPRASRDKSLQCPYNLPMYRSLGRWPLLILLAAGMVWAGPNGASLLYRQPIRFEQNRGQAPARFQYLARTANYTVGLTSFGNEVWAGASVVRTQLVGARPVTLQPSARLGVSTNYFQGSKDSWRTNVPSYERVRYGGLYPGIDLVFYVRQGALEYDFVVQPGSNPDQIELDITGADDIRIDADGALAISTGAGKIHWNKPEIYQTAGNERRAIEGEFVLTGGRVRFRLGHYNLTLPLTIDPALLISTYLGSAGNEVARGVAIDGAGNIYVAGGTKSTAWSTPGVFQRSYGGTAGFPFGLGDAFVAKFSPAGALLFLTYLGGPAEDAASAIAVDSAGNAYVTGFTNSKNFPLTDGAAQTRFGGAGGNILWSFGDAFICKLSPDGTQLVYSTLLGGFQDDFGASIAIDAAGNAYIAGGTLSADLPTTAGVIQPKYGGAGGQSQFPALQGSIFQYGDGFIAKLSADGAKFLFVTYLGGSKNDCAFALAVDSALNVYVAGATLSADFPVGPGASESAFGGVDASSNRFFNAGDGFVAKLNATASAVQYGTYLGGSGDDVILGLTLDSNGNAYVAGATTSTNLPVTASAFQRRYQGPSGVPTHVDQLFGDGFVAKLNPTGALAFLTYLGGESDDLAFAVALDPAGNIAVAGISQSQHFPVTLDAYQAHMAGFNGDLDDQAALPHATQGGGGDAFLAVLDPTGSRMLYGTYLGGMQDDAATAIAVDKSGAFYLTGFTQSYSDFPLAKAQQIQYGGKDSDAFLAKFSTVLPALQAVTNAASNLPGTAPGIAVPGMIFVGYGSQTGPSTLAYAGVDSGGNRVNTVSGVQVLFDNIPAPLYYVSASQVAGWVPYEVAGKTSTQIAVKVNGVSSMPLTVPVAAADPGLFSANFSGSGQAAALNQDGSFNSPTSPAAAGSVVILFGTGEGQTSPAGVDGMTVGGTPPQFVLPITVTIGGLPANVLYSGPAPGQTEGFSQLNVQVPAGAPSGNQPVVVTAGTFHSQANLTIAIK